MSCKTACLLALLLNLFQLLHSQNAYPAPAPPPAAYQPPPPPAKGYQPPPAPANLPPPASSPPPAPAPENPYEQGPLPPPNSSPTPEEYEKDRARGSKNRPFPLDTCYLNTDGFMCCNKELEKVMDKTYSDLTKSRNGNWKKCNINQVAVATQRNAEDHFGVDFEVVAGAGDYSSKNYFSQDLICKIKRDSSYILAFATPAL